MLLTVTREAVRPARDMMYRYMLRLKVRFHGTRQATRLVRNMQRDLLHSNSIHMVGSCRTLILHIIHVSAVFEVGVLERNLLAIACAVRYF